VEVSADQSHAKVFFTLLGDETRGRRRRQPASRARRDFADTTRATHEASHRATLEFKYDASVERGMKLSRLIDEAVGTRPSTKRRVSLRSAAQAATCDRGVLLLDKPRGITSQSAVTRAKRPVFGGEGRTHGDAGPDGDGFAACRLRRSDQIFARAARRGQNVLRQSCARHDDHDRRSRRRGVTATRR
jgi:hypothetical protein